MSAPEHVAGQLDLDGSPVPPAAVAAPNPTSITINVEIDVDLPATDCWPDGQPDTWTVEDLATEIKQQHRTLESFLDDWDLHDGFFATVQLHDGRGNWTTVDLR